MLEKFQIILMAGLLACLSAIANKQPNKLVYPTLC